MTLKNIFASIHQEKRLSMSHWRFRLLHWCFNEGNPKTKHDSDLPNFLYEHYCPLFHLTNFIAIFSPIIFLFRVSAAVVIGLWNSFAQPVIDYISEKAYQQRKVKEDTKEYKLNQFKSILLHHIKNGYVYDFDHLFKCYAYDLEEEECREVYDSIIKAINDAKARKEEIKKRRYDQMVFWSNIGKTFVAWLMYVLYVSLFVASIYAVILLINPLIGLIKFIFSADYSWVIPTLFVLGKLLLLFSVVFVVTYILIRAEFMQPVRTGLKSCVLPFTILSSAVKYLFFIPVNCVNTIKEFISVFYSENCPRITIVSDEEEEIECHS